MADTAPVPEPVMSSSRLVLLTLLALAPLAPLRAAAPAASQASSAASAIPVVVAVTAPAVLASGVAQLTVISVEASAEGTLWLLERASDGARIGLTVSGEVSASAGAVVEVTASSAGWILSTAGEVIAIVPNELGRALLHHERLSR